jgi:hypothetical protein
MAMEWGDLIITPSMTACPPTRRGFTLFSWTEGLDREWPCSESFLVTNIKNLQGLMQMARLQKKVRPKGRERVVLPCPVAGSEGESKES